MFSLSWPDSAIGRPQSNILHIWSSSSAIARGWLIHTLFSDKCCLTSLRYLWELGQLDESSAMLETARNVFEENKGIDPLLLARVHCVQGSIYAHQNKYNLAGELFVEALHIRIDLLPGDSQLLANSYMQVGNFYTSEGRVEEAIHNHRQAIAIRSMSYLDAPGQMCISNINLSRCLIMTKQYSDAEAALDHAAGCLEDLDSKESAIFESGYGNENALSRR